MRPILIIVLMVLSMPTLLSQQEDYIWLFGMYFTDNKQDIPDDERDTTRGATDIDFRYDPPVIRFNKDRFGDMDATNTSVCDAAGSLQLYANGGQIYSGLDHTIVEDTIAYGQAWENQKEDINGKAYFYGLRFIDHNLLLPVPGKQQVYNLLYGNTQRVDEFPLIYKTISIMSAEIEKVGGQYYVGYKDSILIEGSFSFGGINACRHANGRDWWIVVPDEDLRHIHTFLLDPSGIKYRGKQKTDVHLIQSITDGVFSPDGRQYVICNAGDHTTTGCRVVSFSFDRCDGSLTYQWQDTMTQEYGFSSGVTFSHDSRYLYACNNRYLYQYDTQADDVRASRQVVAEDDGAHMTSTYNQLSYVGLAPDGRLLISFYGYKRIMAQVRYPYRRGEACGVEQHSIQMPTICGTGLPNFPTYRLGPVDGSLCDSLGLDNIPVAKFRYDQDTTDYLSIQFSDASYYEPEVWAWDFGDGQTSDEVHPAHRFPEPGTYQVCLTVSNDNGSHTTCRDLVFSDPLNTKINSEKVLIHSYPNPVRDIWLLMINEYLPADAIVTFYNMSGMPVLSRAVYHGWNSLDVSAMLPGAYAWAVRDGTAVLGQGKLVKQ